METWNLDIQKTLPWGIVMSVGYNGSKGNHLDIVSAPRALAGSPETDPSNLIFRYEQAAAFYKFGAGTLRLSKRMSNGIAVGANYQYSHAIDNAGAVGSVGGVGAQNWTDFSDEEGNSSLDQRHKVSGNYVYELPFGQDKHWVTTRDRCARSGRVFGVGQFHVCDRHAADAGVRRVAAKRGLRDGGNVQAEFDGCASEFEYRDGSGSVRERSASLRQIRCIRAERSEMRRVTSSRGRERCRTAWRFRRRWDWETREVSRFGRRSITCSTRCSTREWI